jgi:DNA-binding transcriptional MerR regulator
MGGRKMKNDKVNAKDLAKRFNVPTFTLRRWGREFLSPDPEAGKQKGKARLFDRNDAMILFLAAYLLRNEFYKIEETKEILEDILPWMSAKKLLPKKLSEKEKFPRFEIFIQKKKDENFFRYQAKTILTKELLSKKTGKTTMQESYVMERIKGQKEIDGIEFTRVLHISMLVIYGLQTIQSSVV